MQTQEQLEQLEQLARQAQERSAWEAEKLHEKTRFLTAQVTINTSTIPPPSNAEEMWVGIGNIVLIIQPPFSHLQQLFTIFDVLEKTRKLPPSEKWEPVLTKLQLMSAELLFDFELPMMAIATSKEVLTRHPGNMRALRVVKDVRAQPM
jgi:hypothetical protein